MKAKGRRLRQLELEGKFVLDGNAQSFEKPAY
jgi:hypothetical protein